jgi:hypothetical protein
MFRENVKNPIRRPLRCFEAEHESLSEFLPRQFLTAEEDVELFVVERDKAGDPCHLAHGVLVSLYDRSPILSSHDASVGLCVTTSEITCAPPLEISSFIRLDDSVGGYRFSNGSIVLASSNGPKTLMS